MYLKALTDDELIRYAATSAKTEMEEELLCRLEAQVNGCDALDEREKELDEREAQLDDRECLLDECEAAIEAQE